MFSLYFHIFHWNSKHLSNGLQYAISAPKNQTQNAVYPPFPNYSNISIAPLQRLSNLANRFPRKLIFLLSPCQYIAAHRRPIQQMGKPIFPVTSAPHTVAVTTEATKLNETDVSNVNSEKEACKDIHCDFEATCELGKENFPRCTCQFDCAAAELQSPPKPICASDLRIYPSLCAMKMEACQSQKELRLRPLELCQGEYDPLGLKFVETSVKT